MILYSINGQYPTPVLPNRIRLANGLTKTDSSTFTEVDLKEAGVEVVDLPPNVPHPKKLEWNGVDWVVRDPTDQETEAQRALVQSECARRLAETDYKVIKAVEAGTMPAQEIVTYREELRKLYNDVVNMDPWFVTFPVIQTVKLESDLSNN